MTSQGPCPPGGAPVIVPLSSSPWADVAATHDLSLDFLPWSEFGDFNWEIADARGGLLLLFDPLESELIVCDPFAQRYRHILPSARFRGCRFLGAFVLHGEDVGVRIGLSNFRVTCALYNHYQGTARACAFSPAGAGRWTSFSTVVCGTGYWDANGARLRFAGCGTDGSVAYWTIGGVRVLLALDKEAAELSSSVLPDGEDYATFRGMRHASEYAYELKWPPTIRACLSCLHSASEW
uniref:DUF295 domain-containing protein n=1 Tax=Aegilops tauschii subsp. strangulata TaxID=200361 RepID=A0A453S179_AEGTS